MVSPLYVEDRFGGHGESLPQYGGRPVAGRVEYIKVRNSEGFRVLADFFNDGTEDFGEQAAGEVQWFHYTPSGHERAFALTLLVSVR